MAFALALPFFFSFVFFFKKKRRDFNLKCESGAKLSQDAANVMLHFVPRFSPYIKHIYVYYKKKQKYKKSSVGLYCTLKKGKKEGKKKKRNAVKL